MDQKIKEKIMQLEGSQFQYHNETYKVLKIKQIGTLIPIVTLRKRKEVEMEYTFSFTIENFIAFYGEIEPTIKPMDVEIITHNNKLLSLNPMLKQINDQSIQVNEVLMQLFATLSTNELDEGLAKKASTLVKLSDAMVKNSLIQIKTILQ